MESQYSVLVVEDEKMLRKLLEYRLGKRFRVRTASNGEEALGLIEEEIPDIIVADLMMPVMDGFAFHEALQRDIRTRVVPFIFLTARSDEPSEREARRAGVDDYITKPFDFDALLIRISKLVERAKYYKGEVSTDARDRLFNVFLCHAKEDKEEVLKLYDELEGFGVNPWIDENDILPGQDWELEIRKALRDSHVVLVCLSKRSINKRGYVQKEIKVALDISAEERAGAIFIIPVRLEECSVPDRLSSAQWVDLFEPDGLQDLLKALRHRASSLEGVMLPDAKDASLYD